MSTTILGSQLSWQGSCFSKAFKLTSEFRLKFQLNLNRRSVFFFLNISFSQVKSVRGILILPVMLVDVGVGWCINWLTWKCSQVFIVWSDGATVCKLFKKARNSWTRVTDFKWNLLFSHLEKQITFTIKKATPRRKSINNYIFNFS